MIRILYLATFLLLFSACSSYTSFSPSLSQGKLYSLARSYQHTPYKLGGNSTKGADCSAFTQNILRSFGKNISRTTVTQLQSGKKISRSRLQTLDLVFFRTNRGPNGLHVGIYTSDDKFLHLSTKGGAKEANLNNPYWKSRYIGARRY